MLLQERKKYIYYLSFMPLITEAIAKRGLIIPLILSVCVQKLNLRNYKGREVREVLLRCQELAQDTWNRSNWFSVTIPFSKKNFKN